jgi:hypothetical protein
VRRLAPILLLVAAAAARADVPAGAPPPPPPPSMSPFPPPAPEAPASPERAADEGAPLSPLRLSLEAGPSLGRADGGAFTLGVRATARMGPALAEVSYHEDHRDLPQPDFHSVLLFGGGLAHRLSPRWVLSASALVGSYEFRRRDVYGEVWQDESLPAFALRAGVNARLPWRRHAALAPTLGLHGTVLQTAEVRDRFRRITWGGTSGLVTVTLGLETVPRRERLPRRD